MKTERALVPSDLPRACAANRLPAGGGGAHPPTISSFALAVGAAMSPLSASMANQRGRGPALLALGGSLLGLVFATTSTLDYAAHLDRQLHDVHCSFIPGAPAGGEEEACRVAMYSPYSALMKEQLWGGIPISLFAMGAFAFLAAFALYLAWAGGRAPAKAVRFFGWVSLTPLLVSVAMLIISLTQLGSICKTCAGIYISSGLLAAGGLWLLSTVSRSSLSDEMRSGHARSHVSPALPIAWLAALGAVTLIPALVYASTAPDQAEHLSGCGRLEHPPTEADQLMQLKTASPSQKTLVFEDPLCPTCAAFHDRLKGENALERLDITLALFPLDSECNWMLDRPLHPGACTVSKAVLCGGDDARAVLEWAFDHQEELLEAGKVDDQAVRGLLSQRFGSKMIDCIDHRETKAALNQHLHFAAKNAIPVSTPQMYLGDLRLCDADTDIGLRYTLKRLAPEVLE